MRVSVLLCALVALLACIALVSATESQSQALTNNHVSLSQLRRGGRHAVEATAEVETETEAEAEAETETESSPSLVESESASETEAETEVDAEAESRVFTEVQRKKFNKKFNNVEASKKSKCKGARCNAKKHGWGIASKPPRRVQQRLPKARLTGAASTLTRANVRCVLCQFISQKLRLALTGPAGTGMGADGKEPAADAGAGGGDAGAGGEVAAFVETYSFATAADKARIEATVEAAALADMKASSLPPMFDHGPDAPGRFRQTDMLAHRAARSRFSQVPVNPSKEQRDAFLRLYATVYSQFEDLCAKRMPLAYLPYCNDMLKSYRFFAQGVNYNDRSEQICMNGNFCDQRSYVRRMSHIMYQREPGDA